MKERFMGLTRKISLTLPEESWHIIDQIVRDTDGTVSETIRNIVLVNQADNNQFNEIDLHRRKRLYLSLVEKIKEALKI